MAAAEEKQAEALSLDIPSVLIGQNGRNWLNSHLSEGVLIQIGADEIRCSGGKMLTEPSGTITSGPVGQTYCSFQECKWHVAVNVSDILVLTFSRFSLERF